MQDKRYQLHEFSDRALWVSALAQSLAWDLQQALEQHAQVTLGVSGGSTPLPVYRQLALAPLPWNRITAVIVDERFVALDHADNNERAIREVFASAIAQGMRVLSLYGSEDSLENAAEQANIKLMQSGRGLDVLLLGMGDDGHTASLFPSAENFAEAIRLDSARAVYAMKPMPAHAAHERISMSLAFLRRSGRAYLAITGDSKREVFHRAVSTLAPAQYPISAWFQSGMPKLSVFWSP